MAQHLNPNQWQKVIKTCNEKGIDSAIILYLSYNQKQYRNQYWISCLKRYILQKVKLVHNYGMDALIRKKHVEKQDESLIMTKPKDNIEDFINKLTEKEKDIIIRYWIEEQREKKSSSKVSEAKHYQQLNKTLLAGLVDVHRTSLYYQAKETRIYKYDYLRQKVYDIWDSSMFIYGSRKIAEELLKKGIEISARTLRMYMQRWGFVVETRRPKKKRENKNTEVEYQDLVKRNYNPDEDNIIATDVTYIPAKAPQNHFYLSTALSHKTKMILGWCLSTKNDTKLVINTIKDINNRPNNLIHSDHGKQYSSNEYVEMVEEKNWTISMSRVGDSLDNREAEYFYSCLKGEFLSRFDTRKLSFKQVEMLIAIYISWYNKKRIQKNLNWLSPKDYDDQLNSQKV